MAIFNSYVTNYQRVIYGFYPLKMVIRGFHPPNRPLRPMTSMVWVGVVRPFSTSLGEKINHPWVECGKINQ